MSQVVIRKTENSVGVTLPGGTSFFKTGVLQASNGVSSHGINVQDTETSDYILRDFPFSEIKEADGTQFDTTRNATVTALNNLINASADTFIKDTDKITALDGVTSSDFTAKEGYGVFVGSTDGSLQTSDAVILGTGEVRLGAALDTNNFNITSNTNQNIKLVPGTGGKVRPHNLYSLPTADGTNGQVIQTNGSGTLSFATVSSGGDVVDDTTPQLGGDLDANGFDIDMSGNSASNILVGPDQYVFRLKNGTIFDYGLFFNATSTLHEFINGTGNTIFSVHANTGELTIGDVAASTHYILPSADGSANQVLTTDGSGNVDFVTPTNTNIANTNLTADNNRTLDMDANSLTIDINDGDFTLSDSNASDTYIQASSNVLTLGDGTMTVESDGIFQAKNGIEHDEAGLTNLGDKGVGCEVTYLGSSATSVSQGRVYYYSGATWVAYTPASEAPQKALLGIALGSTMAKGFLLKGFIHPDSGTLTAGSQVFGLTNASVGTTAPTTSGHFQRILGHSISTSVIFFNPSQEYIEIK